MPIKIIQNTTSLSELRALANERFGDLVKAVIDVRRGILAIGGELHADEEGLLLEQGSRQEDLWGINFYPEKSGEELIEFDSMINIRPSQNNRSRSVENHEIQKKIRDIVKHIVSE